MPTQPTQPKKKGVQPVEIPVPRRVEVDRVLERAAQPIPAKPKRSRRKGRSGK
jgi:hypothetical protein